MIVVTYESRNFQLIKIETTDYNYFRHELDNLHYDLIGSRYLHFYTPQSSWSKLGSEATRSVSGYCDLDEGNADHIFFSCLKQQFSPYNVMPRNPSPSLHEIPLLPCIYSV